MIHLYRPWHSLQLLEALPSSVKKLALVEQLSQRTTAWSPLIQDFVSDLQAVLPTTSKDVQIPRITSFQLGAVTLENVRSTLKAISANLNSTTPINNLLLVSLLPAPALSKLPRLLLRPPLNLKKLIPKSLTKFSETRLKL